MTGNFYAKMPYLRADEQKFNEYFGMSPATFDSLVGVLEDHIKREETWLRGVYHQLKDSL